jgi:serine/threonine protein phosphatase 1
VSSFNLTYAVGDIHGRHDLLAALLDGIREHAGGEDFKLVFLGDYIDRGPDSAAVVGAVRALQADRPDRVTCLMGNHEHMLLTVMAEPEALPWWIGNGGGTTLASFGADDPAGLPRELLDWLSRLPTFHEDGRRYFVHAGLRPGVPLPDQTDQDRLWIREPFLSADWDFGVHVVHGHTPLASTTPDVRRHRTNLDTAAVFGGALTAGVFTPERDRPTTFLRVLAGPF